MTYARPVKPIFFTDVINWLKLNGAAKTDIITDRSGTYGSGDKFDIFDLNPQNIATFDTSASPTTHIVIGIDLGVHALDVDYVAILNHNLATAEGDIRIAHSASAITTAGGGTRVDGYTAILNAAEGLSEDIPAPSSNGDTIFSFTSSNDRYWAIEIRDVTNFSGTTDLYLGAVMLGEKYSLPLSPDMSIPHGFNFDGVSITTGLSGKRHSNPSWIKANNTTAEAGNYIPFRKNSGALQIPGRESYSLSYPTMNDTDLLPSDLGTPTGNNFIVNVLSKTGWNALPFILGIDSASTTQGDYMFGRFRENSFVLTQMSANVYSTSFSIDQEF